MSQSNGGSCLSRQEGRITTILKVVHYGGIGVVVVLMVMTTIHVIGRYAFVRPLPGLVELSEFMLITLVFLFGAYTMAVKGHVTLGILVERFSGRIQAIIDSVTYTLCLVLTILAFWQSIVQGAWLMRIGQSSMILSIPYSPFMFIVSIGWGLFALAIVIHLWHILPRLLRKAASR